MLLLILWIDSYSTKSHDDAIKWKRFPRYLPFVRGIHRPPVNSPHKGQWRGALMFSLICAWINGWVNNREAGDLRRHHAHYDVTVMYWQQSLSPSRALVTKDFSVEIQIWWKIPFPVMSCQSRTSLNHNCRVMCNMIAANTSIFWMRTKSESESESEIVYSTNVQGIRLMIWSHTSMQNNDGDPITK